MVKTPCRWSVVARALVAALTIVLVAQSALATTSARVARNTVNIAESLQITFETDQDVSGQPDFSALNNDFEIIGTSKSTSINIINGHMQRAARWILEVMPRREGMLVIPPITIGKESTSAVSITATTQASSATDFFSGDINLEVDVDNIMPYVQGQLIFTVRIVHAVSFDQASLTEPTVTTGDAIIEKLGDDVSYETNRGTDRVGIIERRYAIFPQSSEPMTIAPLRFDARVADGGGRRFDPFARGRSVRKQSDAIEINPKPIPADFSGTIWLPASQLMLVESSPETNVEYRVGEPFTRTLTLQATGLSSSQLPEINAAIPATVRQYPDQPVLENRVSSDGIVGIRHEKMALIPSQPGLVTLPAIEIPWWNTATEQMEYATLPARSIQVVPAPGGTASTTPQSALMTDPLAVAVDSTSNGDQDSNRGSEGNTLPVPGLINAKIWPWLSLLLALGWLATLILWLRSRQRRPAPVDPGAGKRPTTEKMLLGDLRKACEACDAPAAKTALLQWAALQWPGNRIGSLGELAAQFEGDLQLQLHGLSQHLYAQTDSGWNGVKLWQSFTARPIRPLSATTMKQPELEPLYK